MLAQDNLFNEKEAGIIYASWQKNVAWGNSYFSFFKKPSFCCVYSAFQSL